jgi:predicted phage terminase large subunit-like protein
MTKSKQNVSRETISTGVLLPGIERITGSSAPINAKETLRQFRAFQLQDDLYSFMRYFWPVVDSAEFVEGGFAIQAVCEHLTSMVDGTGIRNLIINIPPRFSKSLICMTFFPAWVWAQRESGPTSGPGVQFLCASYGLNLSLQDSVKCRRLISSKQYNDLYPHLKLTGDVNAKQRFENSLGGSRIATSVGASTTGFGGDFLLLDDPNNALESNSDAILDTTTDWFDNAWSTRLNNPKSGCRVVIQQRLSERDITGHILSREVGDWCHLVLPMRFEPERKYTTVIGWEDPRTVEGELLWEERFGDNEVKLLEAQLLTGAAGQLQQRPTPAGGGIIKREWFQPWVEDKYPPFSIVIMSVDTAYTTKQENDFSAITVWGIFEEPDGISAIQGPGGRVSTSFARMETEDVPRIMMVHAWRGKVEFHELTEMVVKMAKDHKVDIILNENKAAGYSLEQELRRLYAHEDWQVRLENPGALDKVARAYAIQHLLADGLIYAPCLDQAGNQFRIWADMVITECESFPKGKNDDLVDTLVQALTFMRKTGMITRAVEKAAEVSASKVFRGNNDHKPLYPI